MQSIFGETGRSLTTKGRDLWNVYRNNEGVNALVTFAVPTLAAWSFLTPWAAVPVTIGSMLVAMPSTSRRTTTGLGVAIWGIMSLWFTSDYSLKEPSTAPSIIAAKMSEGCWKPNDKLLIRVLTPEIQEEKLRESGLSFERGPAYARHSYPDPSMQWFKPYIAGSRNPYYTAEVTSYDPKNQPNIPGTKSYIVTTDGRAAAYDVQYDYTSFWTGKRVHVQKKYNINSTDPCR